MRERRKLDELELVHSPRNSRRTKENKLYGSSPLPACSFTNTSPMTALAQMVPSNPSSLPEAPIMSQAKGKLPSKKGLSTGMIVAVVIVGLL